jgi:uncharacterized protein YndB with AHSA1/START domain
VARAHRSDAHPALDLHRRGGRPEGFATAVGTKFRYVAKPKPSWSGIVECEVLESDEPTLPRYSWADPGGGEVTEVAYRLESHGNGTRFTYEHTGFTGIGGLFMATLLGRVRTKMLTTGGGVPAIMAMAWRVRWRVVHLDRVLIVQNARQAKPAANGATR